MIYHEHQQHSTREEAAALAQATADVGQGKVTALANEGEAYKTTHGRDAVVADGHMLIKLSGDFPDTTAAVYRRAEQIQQENASKPLEQVR